jgi:TonB family protein
MYQLSFRDAFILSTVAHAFVGVACYSGGWLDSKAGAATSETCDGNHIPSIIASIVTELPDATSKSELGAIKSETTSDAVTTGITSTPSIQISNTQAELREKRREKPHYHPLSIVKKETNKEEIKRSRASVSKIANTVSLQPGPPSGSPQSPPASGALSSVSIDASPSYFRNPPPTYPDAARRMRREGVVRLLVTVESNGLPSSITISSSSGHQTLDEAAINAVQNWKFKPGEINGTAVQSKVEVPIRFSLQ